MGNYQYLTNAIIKCQVVLQAVFAVTAALYAHSASLDFGYLKDIVLQAVHTVHIKTEIKSVKIVVPTVYHAWTVLHAKYVLVHIFLGMVLVSFIQLLALLQSIILIQE